ncbi:hypothetical protein MYX07_03105 [Patescibacteria group bacterium AH-259-L07]|nr:hypothetical protein [Patescibacteria group bacterium AH-259-L07]
MKLLKTSFIASLFLTIASVPLVHAEQGSHSLLSFSSEDEFYRAIKEFSQEELGMTLDFEEPTSSIEDKTPQALNNSIQYYYFAKVCPKLRFWSENTPLCSLYVYWDTSPFSSSFREQYDTTDYDIFVRKLERYQFVSKGEQKVPSFNPAQEKLYGTVKKIVDIFHEGFHSYAGRSGASIISGKRCALTIGNRRIEEAAATVVGERASALFISTYIVNKDIRPQWYIERYFSKGSDFDKANVLYDSLTVIYESDVPDSIKLAKKGNVNNAELFSRLIHGRYYRDFEKLWDDTDNPKKSIKLFLQILKSDTDQIKSAGLKSKSIEY